MPIVVLGFDIFGSFLNEIGLFCLSAILIGIFGTKIQFLSCFSMNVEDNPHISV